jgi:hypothetical protein
MLYWCNIQYVRHYHKNDDENHDVEWRNMQIRNISIRFCQQNQLLEWMISIGFQTKI